MPKHLLAGHFVGLILLQACAVPRPASVVEPLQAVFPHLEERALLLLLADRQLYEPFVVDIAQQGPVGLRVAVAETLGRIGDSRGRPSLERLLVDRQVEVRRAAAFGLGQLGDQGAKRALLRATRDPDAATGRLAVEALARLDFDLATVRQALDELPVVAVEERLLPTLYRFPSRQALPVALAGLESTDHSLRSWAAYALARNPLPEALEQLRVLQGDPDAWIRARAARAIGRVGSAEDLASLRPLLEDAAQGPVIQALRAAHRLVRDGRAAPPDDWRPVLSRLLVDSRSGVRMTALEVAGTWLLDEELGDLLFRAAEEGSGHGRRLALLALAAGGDPRARDVTSRLAVSGEVEERASAAAAAAVLQDLKLLSLLIADPDGRVRLAALPGLLNQVDSEAAGWARQALSDDDLAVRASALEWLADYPVVAADDLARAAAGRGADRLIDLGLNLVRALTARGLHQPLERGLVVRLLESLSRARELAVRRRAADGLDELGQPRPTPGAVETGRTVEVYREIVRRTAGDRFVELETPYGVVCLRLECRRAPLTCLNFLQLANQRFYDGIIFHRVVPDFVVQAGDPGGDGWGGPGYTIRDEVTRIRYRRGVLGMALSAADTAGSQFFITLSRQPQLDGVFTAFGRVIAGEEILDQIVQGDSILRIREVEAHSGGR